MKLNSINVGTDVVLERQAIHDCMNFFLNLFSIEFCAVGSVVERVALYRINSFKGVELHAQKLVY